MRLSRAIMALALGITLAGCALLFGGGDPAQLYRFGAEPAPTVQVSGGKFGVLKSTTDFVEAAASDKILTVTQGEAAYIKDARWVSPAAILFDELVDRTFQGSSGRARLITRGEVAKADYVLKLDVRTFEARYPAPKMAPEVVVETRAMLTRNDNRELVAEQVFTSRVQAGDNRVSAIVDAYDRASDQVVSDIYAWVNSGGAIRSTLKTEQPEQILVQ